MLPGRRPFIRNGQIVYDATPEEREAARRTPFPGTGMRLNGPPVIPPQGAPDNQLALANTGGYPPQPPGSGGGVLASLRPTIQFLSSCCSWSCEEISALYLVLDMDLVQLMQALRHREQRARALRTMLMNARSQPLRIPRSMPRPVFVADPSFMDSDIANRAIVNIMQCFDLASGIAILRDTIVTVKTYRCHPLAKNLTLGLHQLVSVGVPTRLVFPVDTGEVMYVINTSYQVIIAARSGHQRDLPHPTLIGGDDPEALSAGLVLFQDGRIIRVYINASGHFKPNALSSIEVSLMVFGRLPAEAFHPSFEGYQVFRHGGPLTIEGPVPTGGSSFNPFQVVNCGDIRGTVEATDALARREQMSSAFKMLENQAKKVVGGILLAALTNLQTDPVFLGFMTGPMRDTYGQLLALMAMTAAPARTRVLGPNFLYQTLVAQLIQRLSEFV